MTFFSFDNPFTTRRNSRIRSTKTFFLRLSFWWISDLTVSNLRYFLKDCRILLCLEGENLKGTLVLSITSTSLYASKEQPIRFQTEE